MANLVNYECLNLTLRDHSASCIIRGNLQIIRNALQNSSRVSLALAGRQEHNQMLKQIWDHLKSNSCQILTIKILMTERIVIDRFQIQNENKDEAVLLEENVHQLFHRLAEECNTQSSFGDIIPVTVEAYTGLCQKWEDEALLLLWSKIALAHFPKLNTAQEVRDWLAISENVKKLPPIRTLDLSNTGIRVIPPEIACCTQLRWLQLNNNKITVIPNFNLPQLLRLELNANQIIVVPDFSHFPLLRELCIDNNNITVIPDFSNVPQLKLLSLDFNKIIVIPDFSHVPQLQELIVNFNEITVIPDFGNLPLLKELHLDGNKIAVIPDFSHVPQLQELYLVGNEIAVIPDFSHVPQLQQLHLDTNKITVVPDFSHVPQLEQLRLCSNQITDIPNFSNLPRLQEISLEGNPNRNGRSPISDEDTLV